jgi:mono/diheme cytochrome c family protein
VALILLVVPKASAHKGDPQAGKTKYDQFCASCHGVTGKGDGPASAALNPKPHDWTDKHHVKSHTNEYFIQVIKVGGAALGKSPLMPPWGTVLSDQDIQNVVAYIRTLSQRK